MFAVIPYKVVYLMQTCLLQPHVEIPCFSVVTRARDPVSHLSKIGEPLLSMFGITPRYPPPTVLARCLHPDETQFTLPSQNSSLHFKCIPKFCMEHLCSPPLCSWDLECLILKPSQSSAPFHCHQLLFLPLPLP